MHAYEATVIWERDGADFAGNRYRRAHRWTFDGGAEVPASPSPLSVPPPLSDPQAVDPEEALVAATSSCHMLFFLSIAAKRGFVVDRYVDHAVGTMEPNAEGRIAITRIALRPRIAFAGERRPSTEELAQIHHESHERCYIANSIRAEVTVETPPKD